MFNVNDIDINILDDKYTILYKYVYKYKYPKQFFVHIDNKINVIYDYFNNMTSLDKYFNHIDLLMIYYESFFDSKQLNDYKKWLLNVNNQGKYRKFYKSIISNTGNLQEYDKNQIIEFYVKSYGYDKKIKDYFENIENIVYYENDNDDIYNILQIYSKTKDTAIFDEIFTSDDYDQVTYEINVLSNIDIVKNVNIFKNKFEDLDYIKYDTKTLVDAYKEWIININQTFLKDLNQYYVIDNNQNLIDNNEYTILKHSPLILDQYIKTFKPYIPDRKLPIDIYDGIDMFNISIVSKNVPYIIYKDNYGLQIYKVYEGVKNNLDDVIKKDFDNNVLYFNIYLNEQIQYEILYKLNENNMYIKFYNFKNLNVYKNIETVIPNIKIITAEYDINIIEQSFKNYDYDIDGNFNIWDIELNEAILYNIILTNAIINKSFYINYSFKYLNKKYIHLIYIPLMSNTEIHIELTQMYYNNDKVVQYIDDDEYKSLQLKKKKSKLIPFINVNFKNVYNYDGFVSIIKMLLYKAKNIKMLDLQFGLNINTLIYESDIKEHTIDENLKLLKDYAPDVFVEGYANFCDKRPKPIEDKDIPIYLKNKIKEYNLDKTEIQKFKDNAVMKFNIKNNTVNLVCDHETDKFPYMKSTTKETKMKKLDKEIYDTLPCCKKLPEKKIKTVKTESHITSFNIINNPGGTGEIDTTIKNILNNYNKNNNNIMRMGVVIDKNSLLHCLCIAMNDMNYINNKNKTEYINTLIYNIASKTNFAVTRQEFYDTNNIEDIKIAFLNNNFLDPSLYYRVFEEYYNINIYVFDPNNILTIPRFNIFHSRPARANRNTVLIYKNHDQYNTYQCELIFNKLDNKIIIFDKDMTLFCHNFLYYIMNTLTFSINNKTIMTYSNLYYLSDYLSFMTNSDLNTMTQYIDDNGKLRGLNMVIGNNTMTMLTIPSQPENLNINNTIYYIDIETALKVFEPAQPSNIVKHDNIIVGLWYKIYDIEHGIYIPVKSNLDNLNSIKEGPINTLITTFNKKDYIPGNYALTKKVLHFLTQVIVWLYYIALYKFNMSITVDEFFSSYIEENININDSLYYNIINIDRRYPIYNSYENYINYISNYIPTNNNKIILYGSILYKGIKHILTISSFNYIEIPIIINNYYKHVQDYTQQKNTLIFLNNQNLSTWINEYSTHVIIYKKLFDISRQNPYIYNDLNGNIYIVQNVSDNQYIKALYVSYYWKKYRINLGYNVIIDENISINPNIYKSLLISKYDKTLSHIELVHQGDSNYKLLDYDYHEVLDKKKKTYAALLQLF